MFCVQSDTDDSLNAPTLMLGESPEASQDVAEFVPTYVIP